MLKSVPTTDIHAPQHYEGVGLPMWILYDHPVDLPDHFVLRLWDGMTNKPTDIVFLATDLEQIEQQMEAVPGRFMLMDRVREDEPKIMATYF